MRALATISLLFAALTSHGEEVGELPEYAEHKHCFEALNRGLGKEKQHAVLLAVEYSPNNKCNIVAHFSSEKQLSSFIKARAAQGKNAQFEIYKGNKISIRTETGFEMVPH